jgi:hypothetical protein
MLIVACAPAEHRDRDQPAVLGEAIEIALGVVAGDHVEAQFGALPPVIACTARRSPRSGS